MSIRIILYSVYVTFKSFFFEIKNVKFAKIANKVCPDIKFANNRIDKLNALEKYEIIWSLNRYIISV